MKLTLKELVQAVQNEWNKLETVTGIRTQESSEASEPHAHFPTIVAHTTEGQVMDGPNGLRLVTPDGTMHVDETPEGFLVYQPVPHILKLVAERPLFFGMA